jgi:hypothetical protein
VITDAELIAVRSFDRTLARNADDAQAIINEKNERLVELLELVEQLQDKIALQKAGIAARDAQVIAFAEAHPDSPLLVHTGKVYPSGRKQTKAGVIFENAFDKKAREVGIQNPVSRRDVAK